LFYNSIMAPQTSTKLTYEDHALLPDDGRRHEILDGEHYVNPSPNTKHQMAVANLGYPMWSHARTHRLGTVFMAPYDVVLADFDVVEPDIVFVSAARAAIITEANIQGAPDLVVEVLSTNEKYDTVVKFKRYEALGVGEYWIVDPERETIAIHRRMSDRFAPIEAAPLVTTPLLPGFELAVRDIFDFAL
jgi:Uma2 family endonuclease